jgi:hypothetical protein
VVAEVAQEKMTQFAGWDGHGNAVPLQLLECRREVWVRTGNAGQALRSASAD